MSPRTICDSGVRIVRKVLGDLGWIGAKRVVFVISKGVDKVLERLGKLKTHAHLRSLAHN